MSSTSILFAIPSNKYTYTQGKNSQMETLTDIISFYMAATWDDMPYLCSQNIAMIDLVLLLLLWGTW